MGTPEQTRRRGRWSLIIGTLFATLTFGAVMASGAELVTAEVTGTMNDVTVTQGSSVASSIDVYATGAIGCTITSSNPSTATVDTLYALDSSGNLSTSSPSSSMN